MARAKRASGEALLTLTEVSARTGVSMPTLQRYKKTYSDRIPSVGEGRRQRYKESAVAVFQKLKEENMARVGRPRKVDSAAPASPPPAGRRGRPKGKGKSAAAQTDRAPRRSKGGAAAGRRAQSSRPKKGDESSTLADVVATVKAKANEGLLTLTEIAQRTGISYPTLMRYVKNHLGRLPHRGTGRKRRFLPDAVEVFAKLRGESRGGRPPKSVASRARSAASGSLAPALTELEKTLKKLESRLAAVETQLKKPLRISIVR